MFHWVLKCQTCAFTRNKLIFLQYNKQKGNFKPYGLDLSKTHPWAKLNSFLKNAKGNCLIHLSLHTSKMFIQLLWHFNIDRTCKLDIIKMLEFINYDQLYMKTTQNYQLN